MSRRASNLLRAADRYIGIPLMSAFALAPKRRRPDDDSVRHVGILKTAAIGDTLLLTGIPEALKARFPGARVTLVTGPRNTSAAKLLGPAIDEIVTIDPSRPLAALARIRPLAFDVLLECGPWPRVDALLGTLSGARYVIGFRAPGQARHYGFDHIVDHDSRAHQLENFRSLARAIGVANFPEPRIAPIGETSTDQQTNRPTGQQANDYVVFHPWSGGYMGDVKQWKASNWIELGARLHRDYDVEIVVTGGAADAERSAEIVGGLKASGAARSIAGACSLAELCPVLLKSRAVVSVNTGVMHLAALLGAPTLSLEGPVPVERWGPIGPRARSVITTFEERGYLDLGFEYRGRRLDCMEGISVDAAHRALIELLSA